MKRGEKFLQSRARRIDPRRYLRPLKLGKHSQDFYVFDTETGTQNRKTGKIKYMLSARPEHFIFGVIYGPRGFVKVIHSVAEFKKEFKKKRYRNKIVYAHNAEYDLSCIYGNIYELDPGAIFNGKFISCGNGVCRFADSFNLLPTSVKKLGEILGLQKGELGHNYESDATKIHDDINYCIRDCEIVYKSLAKMFADLEPSFTIGSLSLKLFRSKYLTNSIKIDPAADQFFEALYGGRTEAFRLGECNASVYDINSAYPYVMKEKTFIDPGSLRTIKNPPHELVEKIMRVGEGFINATVYVEPTEKLPALPFRTNDRLIFPCGEFAGSWTFPEIKNAIAHTQTKIIKIHKIVYGKRIESPFKDFVNDLYTLRNNTNDEFERYYYKLYMNNLYGKLIQRAREEFRFCKTQRESWQFMKERKLRKAELIEVTGGFFLRFETNRIFSHTIAPWGAYVTAYVRVMLHEMMRANLSSLVYCDTDSVFIEKNMRMNSKDLGGWKREEKKIINVRTLKDYVYIDEKGLEKQMLKGVKKDAIQLDPEANVFRYKRMIRTRESFRRTDNLPPGTFIEQLKLLTGDYSKRQVFKDGTTKPFIL